jgi:NADH-quinone oxidoreductase subunit M
MLQIPILSLLIWIPVLGSIGVLSFAKSDNSHYARHFALFLSLTSMLLCALMYINFNTSTADMQFTEHLAWIPSLKINYDLGVDGISMPLVILTCLTTLIVILASYTMVHKKIPQYLAAFMVTQGMVVGVFASLDAMLFYFFWEGMLIPMYISIGVWGSDNRSYAAIKFFLYTFLGSALMLVALLYLRMYSGSFLIADYYTLKMALPIQLVIFFGFFLAFAIKVPMWPLHSWLPDAHTEAPAGGSVVLAALMLKMGAYGFLRFSLPIVPDACRTMEWMVIVLSLIAIVYIGFIAFAQTDMKKLIAYSSVAHMGFVTLGSFMIFVILARTQNLQDAYMSLEGAMTQMIAHSFGSGAMFLAFGMIYEQIHSRNIKDFGGIANTMPIFAAFFMIFAMSNVGLPGTSGFVGEFMVILSAFKTSFWVTLFAASTLVIGAVYTLWMYKRVFYGPIANERVAQLKDIRGMDILTLSILALAVFWIGLYPNALLNVFHATIGHILQLSIGSRLA